MKNTIVRIKEINIHNFKNVANGKIVLLDEKKNSGANLLGLYGQNGSGKTALIDSLSMLKAALCGNYIPESFADCINVNASFAWLKYIFILEDQLVGEKYDISYEFKIKKAEDKAKQNIENSGDIRYKTVIFDEVLAYTNKPENERKKTYTIFNTSKDGLFISKKYILELFGNKKSIETDLLVAKKVTEESSRSCPFSYEVMSAARMKHNNGTNNRPVFDSNKSLLYYIMESLVDFGHYYLYVIPTSNSALNSLNMLSLSFRYIGGKDIASGVIPVNLNAPTLIPTPLFNIIQSVVTDMNIVLGKIIPEMLIDVKNLGKQLLPDGTEGTILQFVSLKNGKEIPLQYESEGIRKIIAVLHLLIAVYNDSSITVAIDELDSGVFEYLLGELLRIIAENGRGQLIFTSHNLRPLETLDKRFIAFTTTNANNRYIRLKNIKTNNNLRDFYYRDIVLGEQKDSVYNSTNNYEISLAFRGAGEVSGI